jgi:hypothetical protein
MRAVDDLAVLVTSRPLLDGYVARALGTPRSWLSSRVTERPAGLVKLQFRGIPLAPNQPSFQSHWMVRNPSVVNH